MELDDSYFMKIALKEAEKAASIGEIPVGAVIAVSYTHLTLPTSDLV